MISTEPQSYQNINLAKLLETLINHSFVDFIVANVADDFQNLNQTSYLVKHSEQNQGNERKNSANYIVLLVLAARSDRLVQGLFVAADYDQLGAEL